MNSDILSTLFYFLLNIYLTGKLVDSIKEKWKVELPPLPLKPVPECGRLFLWKRRI